jgi:iron complex transport system permease protein
LRGITWWMLGSLQVPSALLLRVATGLIAAAFAAAAAFAPEWNALTLGADTAHNVGVRARAAVMLGLGLATLMASAAVALAGLIGFVGLVVPHGMRALVGADHRRLLPASALAGGLLLTVCDALARSVHAPAEIPVGIVTALLGGPFFLFLLRRRKGWAP